MVLTNLSDKEVVDRFPKIIAVPEGENKVRAKLLADSVSELVSRKKSIIKNLSPQEKRDLRGVLEEEIAKQEEVLKAGGSIKRMFCSIFFNLGRGSKREQGINKMREFYEELSRDLVG